MTGTHEIRRVRRETRRRELTVTGVEPLGDVLLRVRLAGDDLADFESEGADDHVKLFFEDQGQGRVMRDYTPRLFDAAARTLAIDFALHDDDTDVGPATRWAMRAKPGDVLTVGGPRGSTIVPDDFDWYLLVGDETAIPAIARRVEELRDDATVFALISLQSGSMPPPMPERSLLTVNWLGRDGKADGGASLLAALSEWTPPRGDGFVWIGAEAQAARAVRAYLVDEVGQPKAWIKASGYWLVGQGGAHTKIGDE